MDKLNLRGRRGRRGFTLAEVIIAVGITSMVMLVMTSLQFMSARTSRELMGKTHMRASRMQAIDAVRYRLVNARIGSCIIDMDARRIRFEDPNLPGTTSGFIFNPSQRTLFFDDELGSGDPPLPVARGPIDITFEAQEGGAVVLIRVKSASSMPYQDLDEQEGEVAVYLRNI